MKITIELDTDRDAACGGFLSALGILLTDAKEVVADTEAMVEPPPRRRAEPPRPVVVERVVVRADGQTTLVPMEESELAAAQEASEAPPAPRRARGRPAGALDTKPRKPRRSRAMAASADTIAPVADAIAPVADTIVPEPDKTGLGVSAEPPIKPLEETEPATDSVPEPDPEPSEEISSGMQALIDAGLVAAPKTKAEERDAALAAQVAFEFDRVAGIFGPTAARQIAAKALLGGAKFGGIEKLSSEQLPVVLAALRTRT